MSGEGGKAGGFRAKLEGLGSSNANLALLRRARARDRGLDLAARPTESAQAVFCGARARHRALVPGAVAVPQRSQRLVGPLDGSARGVFAAVRAAPVRGHRTGAKSPFDAAA